MVAITTQDLLAASIASWCDGATGVSGVARLSGGASQETWSFDIAHPDGVIGAILRRAPQGYGAASGRACGLVTEAALIRRAHQAGVPVPVVLHVLTEADGLGIGFIMKRIEGETIPRKILRDAPFAAIRPQLARQLGGILAGIHGLPLGQLPELRRMTATTEIDELARDIAAFNWPRPVFQLALRWLRDHDPGAGERLTLVHGDFRHGNLMIGPDGMRAVLDWELAHLGDPMEDLGWICVNSWRFGEIDHPVGGFGSREELFAGYEAAGGGTVDPARVKFWEVMGTLRWGVMCCGMMQRFRDGPDHSMERAMIGRRSSETEIDLLRLLSPRGRDAG
ncbi:MAG: phosphotransferase family protein [Tardiphaga sp.]|nr:phosphotransferase family protein [Tardiphaga sp.]